MPCHFDTIPAHKTTTPTTDIKVSTSEHFFDAGVQVDVSVYMTERKPGEDISDSEHRSHVGFLFNLTPDEADFLASVLVAHAWDRRNVEEQHKDWRAARRADREAVTA